MLGHLGEECVLPVKNEIQFLFLAKMELIITNVIDVEFLPSG